VAVIVELNLEGVRAILFSNGVAADLSARANAIANRAGMDTGFRPVMQRGKDRLRAAIYTATVHARNAEAKDHRLLRALDAAR
jgi:hypothetical protein